jgi:aminopeptidase S
MRAGRVEQVRRLFIAVVVALLVAACDSSGESPGGPSTARRTTESVATSTMPTPIQTRQVRFRPAAAKRSVVFLAGRIGPRQATSPAYRRAAEWVEARFSSLAYKVTRQYVRVPAGVSWGVPVPAGRTWSIVARPAGLRLGQPYRIVGAHLDTVPQAPGAEDNASGIAVLLELARMAAAQHPAVPVEFVAFGAEEPRGEGDLLHHFGSTAMVARLSGPARRNLKGMVALDRVGVGRVVPVCTGGMHAGTVRRSLLQLADQKHIPALSCVDQASDHWSFEKAGLPAARVGGTPYGEYHSAADRPHVVQEAQLSRAGRLMWAWITS